MDAPVHYFMGQIEVESGCNEGVTSFDHGMGLGQFTQETAVWIHGKEASLQEFTFNPYDPRWNIRALILYDRWLYVNTACRGWYYAFRAYNGGIGNLNREIRLANSCEERAVERMCNRRIINFKNRLIDLCKVNIEYPYKIFRMAEKYD